MANKITVIGSKEYYLNARGIDSEGAIDPFDCYMKLCNHGKCILCGLPKHCGIHGPLAYQPIGSKPFGHKFILDEKHELDKAVNKIIGK